MHRIPHRRRLPRTLRVAGPVAFALAATCLPMRLRAQDTPAPSPTPTQDAATKPKLPPISPRQAREADDAYLAGARQLTSNDPAAAQKSFEKAIRLDPSKQEYILSLAIAKEHHVTALVQQAAKERLLGHTATADKLLAEAQAIDPTNLVVAQHFDPASASGEEVAGASTALSEIAHLGGAIHLIPSPSTHSFHRRGDVQDIAREVYTAYGIKTTFDASITSQPIRFDLDDADYATATRVLLKMTHNFAVPLAPHSALIAKDTTENRDRLYPMVEETFYIPGISVEQLNELSNVAKNIFDIKQVVVQASGNRILMRGHEDALDLVNATYAGLLDGGAETVLQVHIYEYDRTHNRDIGFDLPTSASAFSIAAEAQSLVNANQSALSQAEASGLLVLSGSYGNQLIQQVAFLIGSGLVNVSKFSALLGTFGGGLTLGGLALGNGATFNLLLNSTEVRSLDEVQIRVGDNKEGVFRSGSRYPIITSTYSSGISSAASAALAGVKIGGQSASSLLAQLTNTQSVVPQIQFEDLGLTLKATPTVQKSGQVHVKLEMKIEALGGTSINAIPVLNSRALTSEVTVPAGQTVLLGSEISRNEVGAISGLPYLSEIPGFQGTDRMAEVSSGELLITITPRVVRRRSDVIATRRLLSNVSPIEQ